MKILLAIIIFLSYFLLWVIAFEKGQNDIIEKFEISINFSEIKIISGDTVPLDKLIVE